MAIKTVISKTLNALESVVDMVPETIERTKEVTDIATGSVVDVLHTAKSGTTMARAEAKLAEDKHAANCALDRAEFGNIQTVIAMQTKLTELNAKLLSLWDQGLSESDEEAAEAKLEAEITKLEKRITKAKKRITL